MEKSVLYRPDENIYVWSVRINSKYGSQPVSHWFRTDEEWYNYIEARPDWIFFFGPREMSEMNWTRSCDFDIKVVDLMNEMEP